MSMDSSVDGTVPLRSPGSTASSSTQSEGVPLAVGELYDYTVSIADTKEIEAVWLSHSYPSPISLKLRDIQETVKANGCMDADTLNFAIRKLVRENYECLGSKHYVNTDFATHAISEYEEDEYSSLESCIDDEFVDHHNNALNQDLNRPPSHPNSEVLCIPVFHDGHWSLYAFNMKDRKVSILDPKQECKCHEDIRPKICKALEFVKVKFNIFKNKSNNFSSWGYEVVKECSQTNNNRDDDSGFLVFKYMHLWGQQPPNPGSIPTADSTEMRKQFLSYILSFKDNEAYQLPSRASQLIQNLPGGPAWTRCEMDSSLHKALIREDNKDEFTNLFSPSIEAQELLLRGTTCDGDGMLHIAVRHGKLEVLKAMKDLFVPSAGPVEEGGSISIEMRGGRGGLTAMAPLFAESLRARNNRGETCLHEAVRRGNTEAVESLIGADEKVDGGRTSSTPPLVQRVDYQGVSPLYLATTLRSGDIVGILTRSGNRYSPSFSGPGGKTAMHAAVLAKGDAKVLTKKLLEWTIRNNNPGLICMGDKSGSTPLHLLASEGGASIAELLLLSPDTRGMSWARRLRSKICPCTSPAGNADDDDMREGGSCTAAALKKDSNGWFPIHVAAANGRLDIVKKLVEVCPDCMQSRNDSGQTFLHLAVEKKMENVVHHVCSQRSLAGILNLADWDGNTALHLAVKTGSTRIFCSLVSNSSVGLSFANKEWRTPLDLSILCIKPGLHLLLNSRVLIKYHLRLSGSDHGTYRRDLLKGDDKARGELDKDKLSESISKSAGLMAVCAIFMLNISVATFYNVAKQNLSAAVTLPPPPPPPPPFISVLDGVARGRAFRALIVSDALTFASSSLAAFCSIFAGFSTMDRPTRLVYLGIAGFSLRVACLAVVAVFVLAAYLAFAPVDPHIATAACVLPLLAVSPQLLAPFIILVLHEQAVLTRLFQKHVSPRLRHALQVTSGFFQNHVSPIFEYVKAKLPQSLSAIITALVPRFKSCCVSSILVCLAPVAMSIVAAIGAVAMVIGVIAIICGIIAAIVFGIIHLVTD